MRKLSWPGRARASATTSFTDFAGTDGCTENSNGAWAGYETGAKSRVESYAIFG